MTNTTNDLTALREMAQAALELSSKAIAGPWHWNGDYEILDDDKTLDYGEHWVLDCPDMTHVGFIVKTAESYEEGSADIEFVVKSRQLVPGLAAALLAALDRVEELTARYEGPFVPVESAKEGDVLGYSQVVYAGRGKPLRQQFSPEELDDLADSGEVGN